MKNFEGVITGNRYKFVNKKTKEVLSFKVTSQKPLQRKFGFITDSGEERDMELHDLLSNYENVEDFQ